jgi:gas vesicle protein
MTEERYSNAPNSLLCFLLGGLTGAAIALLYAPRSGRETREILGERLREGAEKGWDLKDQIVARSRELLEDAGEYADRQKKTVENQRERLATAIDAGRKAYSEGKKKE